MVEFIFRLGWSFIERLVFVFQSEIMPTKFFLNLFWSWLGHWYEYIWQWMIFHIISLFYFYKHKRAPKCQNFIFNFLGNLCFIYSFLVNVSVGRINNDLIWQWITRVMHIQLLDRVIFKHRVLKMIYKKMITVWLKVPYLLIWINLSTIVSKYIIVRLDICHFS